MTGRRLPRLLLAALLAGAAAAAAVALNLVLLGRAATGNDQVGQLRPRLTTPAATTRAPPQVLRPTHGVVGNEGADD